MQKGSIKKAFGFLIIVIAIGIVGVELILSIFNSYGAQLSRRKTRFRQVRRIDNDSSLQLIPKLANFHDTGMLTVRSIYYRIARRKAATATAPSEETKKTPKKEQKGTSGGGGQVNLPAVNPNTGDSSGAPVPQESPADQGQSPDASDSGTGDGGTDSAATDTGQQDTANTQPAAGGNISSALSAELVKLFKSKYSPNKDDVNKFQEIVNSLSSDEHGKLMKSIIDKGISIDKILNFNNEFFTGLSSLMSKLNKEQKEVIFQVLNNEYSEYTNEGMQNIANVISFYKSENAKKLKHKLDNSLLKSYASIFGHREDNVSAAIKYLVTKEIDLQSKMRYLERPVYKIISYLVTIIFLLASIAFIFKMELSRIFIMFFGIIKILFLFTVPIVVFHGITGLVVLLSIISIVLTFVSMYIVDLRIKKQSA